MSRLIQSRNPLLAPLVTLALTTSARCSERGTPTWEQADLAADFGLSPVIRLERTKSGEPRTVPLVADAVAALTGLQPHRDKRTGPVFRLHGSSVRKAFDKALAGLVGNTARIGATAHGVAQLAPVQS